MKALDEFIEQFQRIYSEEFREEISKEEAYEKFLRLINLLRVILRPTPQKGQDIKGPGPFSFEFDQSSKNDKLEKNH